MHAQACSAAASRGESRRTSRRVGGSGQLPMSCKTGTENPPWLLHPCTPRLQEKKLIQEIKKMAKEGQMVRPQL